MGNSVFDFKKEYKDLYLPKGEPSLIDVPAMNFIMVDGEGDPNGNPYFEKGVELLYALSYAIKMSKMQGLQPEDYFDYVVPPLEGLWWVDSDDFSFTRRDNWKWTIMIRQPEFVTPDVFNWAMNTVKVKKGLDVEKARFETFTEGLCVQIMHLGPYADEPETMKKIEAFIKENNMKDLLGNVHKHHEIYLTDPRKANSGMKTVLRHPVAKV